MKKLLGLSVVLMIAPLAHAADIEAGDGRPGRRKSTPSSRAWASIASVPVLLFWAKLNGLYDRDESLIRKTTLDEAPKLFQLATLCALVVWLAGGLLVSGERALDRPQAFFLWIALTAFLMLARGLARALALRIAPVERCLFIGDEESAGTIRAKLNGDGLQPPPQPRTPPLPCSRPLAHAALRNAADQTAARSSADGPRNRRKAA